jgi:hypothetical protein
MYKLGLIITVLLIAGCQQSANSDAPDPDRLLHMAGEEAGQITAPRERLARQLNIANRETAAGHPADARKTLADARQTLECADRAAFSDQDRLAGWVSLSELARNADDKPFANGALDHAMSALDAITPVQARCEYVLGVEREVRALRGDTPAARLLVTAADWAMEIPAQPTRRSAYFAFADGCFRCSDYDGARTVLRKDQDAAWRSDALTVMSDRARRELQLRKGSFSGSAIGYTSAVMTSADAPAARMAPQEFPTSFGKQLDFQSNYFRPQ